MLQERIPVKIHRSVAKLKMKYKSLISVLLVVSMLFGINSVYAKKPGPILELVTEKQVGKQAIKVILEKDEVFSFSKKDRKLLQDNLAAVAYDEAKDAYVAYFEYKDDNDNGWFLMVFYDAVEKSVIDILSADIGNESTEIRTLNGKSGTMSKQETLEKIDCEDCGTSNTYSKSNDLSFVESLFIDNTANAGFCDATEQEKCGWTSVVACALIGLFTGGWGGLVCAASTMYICTYVPLSETNCWGA